MITDETAPQPVMFVKERVEPADLGGDDRADHEALGCLEALRHAGTAHTTGEQFVNRETDYQVRRSLLGL